MFYLFVVGLSLALSAAELQYAEGMDIPPASFLQPPQGGLSEWSYVDYDDQSSKGRNENINNTKFTEQNVQENKLVFPQEEQKAGNFQEISADFKDKKESFEQQIENFLEKTDHEISLDVQQNREKFSENGRDINENFAKIAETVENPQLSEEKTLESNANSNQYEGSKDARLATSTKKCQSASDCKSHQICYLPTNECKDQLTLSLTQRSTCATKDDCKENEVCFLSSKTCVCDLNSVEVLGSCQKLSTIGCNSANAVKFTDDNNWSLSPFCSAYAAHDELQKIHLGTYTTGTGLTEIDPMIFEKGDPVYCGFERSLKMYYFCYCDEYTCADNISHKTVDYFVGEYEQCEYTFLVFTPLACASLKS